VTLDLFADQPVLEPTRQPLGAHAVLLRGFALPLVDAVWPAVQAVLAAAPPRQMLTPGGRAMSARLSSCGTRGWVSDARGYRYSAADPATGQPWPAMPACFMELAESAAAQAGYADFVPNACLINQYAPGAKLSLHQDKDERDLRAPIVSLSLGLPAAFLFGTPNRKDPTQRYRLVHGDVVVWGGPSRLAYHGVMPLADGEHGLLGRRRVSLTFRQAG